MQKFSLSLTCVEMDGNSNIVIGGAIGPWASASCNEFPTHSKQLAPTCGNTIGVRSGTSLLNAASAKKKSQPQNSVCSKVTIWEPFLRVWLGFEIEIALSKIKTSPDLFLLPCCKQGLLSTIFLLFGPDLLVTASRWLSVETL